MNRSRRVSHADAYMALPQQRPARVLLLAFFAMEQEPFLYSLQYPLFLPSFSNS